MAGFADTDTLIDRLLEIYENVSASDTDNTTRRARLLQYSQEALDDIWIAGDWLFTYKTGTVSMTAAGDTGDLPSDFMEFGEVGGIFNDSIDAQLDEVRPVSAYGGVIESLAGEDERVVSAYGVNTTSGARTLRFRGNAVATTTLNILYRFNSPTLVDTTNSVTSKLFHFPLAYHNSVLLPKILSKMAFSHGEIGSRDYEAEYERGLKKMAARERARKTTPQKPPMTNIGMW